MNQQHFDAWVWLKTGDHRDPPVGACKIWPDMIHNSQESFAESRVFASQSNICLAFLAGDGWVAGGCWDCEKNIMDHSLIPLRETHQ